MHIIILKDILNTTPALPEAGSILYNRIRDASSKNEKTVIDMDNITALPSIFLNTSIGRIIDVYGVDWLKKNVSFQRITRLQAERLRDYLIRYKS